MNDAILTKSYVHGHATEHGSRNSEVVNVVDTSCIVVANNNSWDALQGIRLELAVRITQQIAKAARWSKASASKFAGWKSLSGKVAVVWVELLYLGNCKNRAQGKLEISHLQSRFKDSRAGDAACCAMLFEQGLGERLNCH
jgi:hypothetical protein